MKFLSKPNISLILLAVFGYISGILSFLLGIYSIILNEPTGALQGIILIIIGFAYICICLPVSVILLLASIIEHNCRAGTNSSKIQQISEFRLIFTLIGLIFNFLPIFTIIGILTYNSI